MSKIVGVQFKKHGKVYDFECGHFVLKKGDKVIVVSEEGPAVGFVCTDPQNRNQKDPERELKKIFRLATAEEIERFEIRDLRSGIGSFFRNCFADLKS